MMMMLAHVTPTELPVTAMFFALGIATGVVLSWAWRHVRSGEDSGV
jgi:hypothetical protein